MNQESIEEIKDDEEYLEDLLSGVLKLRVYRAFHRIASSPFYLCEGISGYFCGHELSSLISSDENASAIFMLIWCGMTFWMNYKAVNQLNKGREYTKLLKSVKSEIQLAKQWMKTGTKPDEDKIYDIKKASQKIKVKFD